MLCRVGNWRGGRQDWLGCIRGFPFRARVAVSVAPFPAPPPRTQHEDFPHCALLHISRQDLWDLSGQYRFRHRLLHRFPTEALARRQGRSAFLLPYSSDLRSCRLLDAFIISSLPHCLDQDFLCSKAPSLHGRCPLHRYYGPSRHPLAFHRLPGCRQLYGLTCSVDFSTGRGGLLQLLSMPLSPCHP